jgi:hypothetical protein
MIRVQNASPRAFLVIFAKKRVFLVSADVEEPRCQELLFSSSKVSSSRLPMLVLICCNAVFCYSWGKELVLTVTNTNCGCTILITVLKNIK